MIRSMFSAISGIKNHQTKMDVISNNIANVNTLAYKSSRVTFQDIYSQTIKPASSSTGVSGGTNPQQIGMGVGISSIDTNFTPSANQVTGNALDLALEGDGFFVVTDGSADYYTRAGSFTFDGDDNIVNPNGLYLLDEGGGQINTTGYTEVEIDLHGIVSGLDEYGDRQEIAILGIATFSNNNGLEKVGGNLYRETQNTGTLRVSSAEDNGQVKVRSGSLEMSNVDLANEFTEMIVTQRGFQANSRVITTSDAMLEELVNLKR